MEAAGHVNSEVVRADHLPHGNRTHARTRGARVLAELVGFATNSDGNHITQPQARTMQAVLCLALDDAGLAPEAIGFVNGHGVTARFGSFWPSLRRQIFRYDSIRCRSVFLLPAD